MESYPPTKAKLIRKIKIIKEVLGTKGKNKVVATTPLLQAPILFLKREKRILSRSNILAVEEKIIFLPSFLSKKI